MSNGVWFIILGRDGVLGLPMSTWSLWTGWSCSRLAGSPLSGLPGPLPPTDSIMSGSGLEPQALWFPPIYLGLLSHGNNSISEVADPTKPSLVGPVACFTVSSLNGWMDAEDKSSSERNNMKKEEQPESQPCRHTSHSVSVFPPENTHVPAYKRVMMSRCSSTDINEGLYANFPSVAWKIKMVNAFHLLEQCIKDQDYLSVVFTHA